MIGWAIDRDHLAEPTDESNVGIGMTLAESEATSEGLDRPFFRQITIGTGLKAGEVENPVRFRMLDDDREVYYGGAISAQLITGEIEQDPDEEEIDHGYMALQWAMNDSGCTEIHFKASDLEKYGEKACAMVQSHLSFARGHEISGGTAWIIPY